MLMSDKIDFKLLEKKRMFYNDRGSINQQERTIINICTPNNRVPKDMKQKLTELKGEIKKKNLWNAAQAVLIEKFIGVNAYI